MIHQTDFDRHMQMDIERVLAELKANPRFKLINNVISEMEWNGGPVFIQKPIQLNLFP